MTTTARTTRSEPRATVRHATERPATTDRRRPPAAAITAIVLTMLAAVVGAYGACYFTALDGWTPISETFVATYLAFGLFGLVSAGSLLFGTGSLRSAARYGVAAYGVWMIYFTIFKLVRFSEFQAIPFGVVGLLIVIMSLARPTRTWAG
jgi:hypothetical protein